MEKVIARRHKKKLFGKKKRKTPALSGEQTPSQRKSQTAKKRGVQLESGIEVSINTIESIFL